MSVSEDKNVMYIIGRDRSVISYKNYFNLYHVLL